MTKAAELAKMGEVLTNSQVGGRRNIIINGAMKVAQRGTSTTGLQNTGGVFTIDRFAHRRGGTWSNFEAKHEQVDVTDSLPASAGLNHALRVTCTTAEGSVPSGDEAVAIGHYFEKGDTHQLGVGTSSMSTSILSFYVKSSIATTFGVSITANQHSTLQVLRMPFTISSVNTYQRITLTIPTYNVALDSDLDTAQGWIMHFMLDGTAASETNSVWGARVDGNVLMPKDVSTTGFSNTLNATFEITGVQLEKGNKATPFEHRSFGEELALCQRYCVQIVNTENGSAHIILPGMSRGSTNKNFTLPLPVTMRHGTPSVTLTGDVRLLNPEAHDFVNATDTLTCGGITPTLVYMGNMLGLLFTGSVTGVTDTTNADYNFQIVSASDHLFIIDAEL